MGGSEVDQTGESRDNGSHSGSRITSVAYSWRNHWVAISIPKPCTIRLSVETGKVQCNQFGPPRPRHRVNRSAHLLIPPLRRMKAATGSELGLYSAAYRSTRDHFNRVRLSTFAGSEVQRMMAANGSSWSNGRTFCNHRAFWARSRARFSSDHHATKSKTAVR